MSSSYNGLQLGLGCWGFKMLALSLIYVTTLSATQLQGVQTEKNRAALSDKQWDCRVSRCSLSLNKTSKIIENLYIILLCTKLHRLSLFLRSHYEEAAKSLLWDQPWFRIDEYHKFSSFCKDLEMHLNTVRSHLISLIPLDVTLIVWACLMSHFFTHHIEHQEIDETQLAQRGSWSRFWRLDSLAHRLATVWKIAGVINSQWPPVVTLSRTHIHQLYILTILQPDLPNSCQPQSSIHYCPWLSLLYGYTILAQHRTQGRRPVQ